MDIHDFCRTLPKIELHAHLNGSLSRSTILELKRYHADTGLMDITNVYSDEFEIGAGDSTSLSECFHLFSVAHSLTTTPQALAMATTLTLKEFQDDGCCYIELRSTPRDTAYMNKKEYIDTIVKAMRNSATQMAIISRLLISINRNTSTVEAEAIADLAIEFYRSDPDVVVGIELSGNPAIGKFQYFKSPLTRAREAGLKVTLHCGEICNQTEIMEMLEFQPDRIGHGTCIHPRLEGTDGTWKALCKSKIPVEVCLTSNVKTKSIPDYNTHHFKDYYDANIPFIICTDDKGVFATSLSQEYVICAETFDLSKSQLAQIALNSCTYVFAENMSQMLKDKLISFVNKML